MDLNLADMCEIPNIPVFLIVRSLRRGYLLSCISVRSPPMIVHACFILLRQQLNRQALKDCRIHVEAFASSVRLVQKWLRVQGCWP